MPEPKAKARGKSKPATAGARKSAKQTIRLGHLAANGIAPSMLGLIERGAHKRPTIVRSLQGRVELRFDEDFAPVQVTFEPGEVLVQDGGGEEAQDWDPDLVIYGSLPDVVQLAAAPLFGGVPKPTNPRGRAALASVAKGQVRIEGSALLARRFLKLLEL